ncbi:hypothetical protein G5C51_02535 [Streptomyces sp. A7024]|uniref:Uncharacterized protein n=1 Tax=Streptomyces coryli TaxID=1128680 RepID=A0A6G4TTB4_9ACTN|nr:hypothetical protein [Streptomyces coryli]NGN62780.1 hypothetical protein [Streptomyces coryli]
MREVTFTDVPEVDVRFLHGPSHHSGAQSTRAHLPHRVAPGETYTDAKVDYVLSTRLQPGTTQ